MLRKKRERFASLKQKEEEKEVLKIGDETGANLLARAKQAAFR
jgi:hypothetical protein